MSFGISEFLQLIGSLCFFVYGMKMMSDGIQRAAGNQLRNILRTMTKNRFLGVFTGFFTTAVVQSSSATTVMTVSFVNAGLLTLVESAGVMMGANIGTTITGWLVSILGFKVKLSAYSIPLFVLGVPFLFSSRGKLKYWGEFIIGFAILFLGLSYLKDSVPDIKGNVEALAFLKNFTEWGIFSRIFFVILGTIVTIVVQSSSAAMAVTLTMCAQGWLPFEVAASMILGENIGTTITAELASLVGNTNAKRSARIHSLFNIIGVCWMIFLMPYILPIVSSGVQYLFNVQDPYTNATDMPIGLSAFHTVFNLLNVILLLGFVKFLVKAAIYTVKENPDDDDEMKLKFISSVSKTPELAIGELMNETAHFGEVVSRMNGFAKELINSVEPKQQKKLLKKLRKYEKISDSMEIEITEYITKLSNSELTPSTGKILRSILNICNDLERIGDIYYQISMTVEQKNETKAYFTPNQRNNVNSLLDKVDEAFAEMILNLKGKYGKINKQKADQLELEINELRDQFRNHNLSRLGDEDYNVKSAMIYNNMFSALEKVGDHIINVTESVAGEI